MGLAFWRNYHEQQAARQAATSPVQALGAVIDRSPPKTEAPAPEAIAAPPPPPPPKPEPKPAPRSAREEAIEKIRARTNRQAADERA